MADMKLIIRKLDAIIDEVKRLRKQLSRGEDGV